MALFDRKTGFGLRVVIPAVVILVSTAAVVVVALDRMANKVDQIENSVTEKTVEASVQSFLDRLALANPDDYGDLGLRDPAGRNDNAFLRRAFATATAVSEFYDTAFLLDGDSHDLVAYRRGRKLDTPSSIEFGPGLAALIRRLPSAGAGPEIVTGVIETRNGLAAVAVGPVTVDHPAAGEKPRLLLLAQAFDDIATAELASRYLLPGLRLSFSKTRAGGVELADPLGRTVATLFWERPSSGRLALRAISPIVITMLVFLGVVIASLIASAWRSIKEVEAGEKTAYDSLRRDPLTRLNNRLAARERLSEMLTSAHSEGRPVAAALLDLDDFKQVNDTYGHETGDRLIALIAERLSAFAQNCEFLGRIGGDEFAIWAFDDGTALRRVGERLNEFLASPINLDGRVIAVGASIGIAAIGDESVSRDELLRRTELAMYQAKEGGGNRVAVYNSAMDIALKERLAIVAELRDAIMAGEIDVVYQPVYDAATRTITGAEALARWTRQGHGPVPPDVFVPIAEQSGLIGLLGSAVLRRACRDARAWPQLHVSVNISPAQFRDPMFEHILAEILEETGCAPHQLILEMTETYLISDPGRAKAAINAIRAMGVAVALDDFGTGFSSIGYLRQFTFDHLKLDRSVVADIARNEATQRLIQATIALADALGLAVTAEGVESEEDATILRLAGCRWLQGFLLSRPISLAQFNGLVAAETPPALRLRIA